MSIREEKHKIILKINHSKCLKCNKKFKLNEEIIFLKDSRMLHKTCYDKLRLMIKNDV